MRTPGLVIIVSLAFLGSAWGEVLRAEPAASKLEELYQRLHGYVDQHEQLVSGMDGQPTLAGSQAFDRAWSIFDAGRLFEAGYRDKAGVPSGSVTRDFGEWRLRKSVSNLSGFRAELLLHDGPPQKEETGHHAKLGLSLTLDHPGHPGYIGLRVHARLGRWWPVHLTKGEDAALERTDTGDLRFKHEHRYWARFGRSARQYDIKSPVARGIADRLVKRTVARTLGAVRRAR